MSDGFKWEICDEKGRILFGRQHNEDMIFMRYKDMDEEEKDLVLSVYLLSQEINEADIRNEKRKEMEEFLNFQDETSDEEKFCG